MMTNEQYLLGKLAEEAAELAQIAIKAQQFGIDEVFGGESNPDALSNRDRIESEYNDVQGIINMLHVEEGIIIASDPDRHSQKIAKVSKWRNYARKLGLVE